MPNRLIEQTAQPSAQGAAGGAMPSGADAYTLRFDVNKWVASSILTNDGTHVSVGEPEPEASFNVRPSAISQVALSVRGLDGQSADTIEVKDHSNGVLARFSAAGQLIVGSFEPRVGATATFYGPLNVVDIVSSNSAGALGLGVDHFRANGQNVASLQANCTTSGIVRNTGIARFFANETHAASNLGTNFELQLCPIGSTTLKARLRVTSEGDVVTNAATTALTPGFTAGALHIPSCTGKPSSVPATFAGNVPSVFDTANKRPCWHAAAWVFPLMHMLASSTGTGSHTIPSEESIRLSNPGPGVTEQLPLASTATLVFVKHTNSGSANSLSVARQGSDTLNGGTSAVTLSPGQGAIFVSDGASAWHMIGPL